jgi:uncharacterized 2Fe-2S/4Fe-4S cluster protein (DUF4445 family)
MTKNDKASNRKGNNSKNLIKVSFPEEDKEISITKGSSVFDAAIAAGIFINSVCGGEGRCGKCKIIAKGKFKAEKSELISKQDVKNGISLACTTKILGDTEIKIPDTSKVSTDQILTKCEMVEIDKPRPMTWKYHLELPEPTIDDNLSDFARLKKELIKQTNFSGSKHKITEEDIFAQLSILQELPKILRENSWEISVTAAKFDKSLEIIHVEPGDTTGSKYGICVDIGTTTIVAELIDLNTGDSQGCVSNYNKQKVCGEDVLSRIMYAEEHGVEKLQELVIENVNYLINELVCETPECNVMKVDRENVYQIVFAGNTTMIHMLLGLDPQHIRREPYIPTFNEVPYLKAKNLRLAINPDAIVYCLPSRASWVGGDITADVLATNMHKSNELSLMIDVGTNGEVVLGNSEWLIGCSCSAGPAFEGGEVQFGMNASLGAIEKVQISEDLNVRYKTIGNAPPKGICGSGLIDLLAELFAHKIIDRNGHFRRIEYSRLQDVDNERVFILVYAKETGFEFKRDIYVTETDIKNIIRTKAAVFAACYLLLKTLGYSFDDLTNLYIAGGFGNYLDTKKAILLGLLPDVPLEKFKFIGNGSLAGSYLTLLSEDNKIEAEQIFEQLTYIELSVRNDFYNEFVSALFLPHTNISLFPSVKEII